MKKIVLFALVWIASLHHFPQGIQQEATAINIEVPVRVYDGNTFVPNLTKDDFELFVDGEKQVILASYFIKERIVKTDSKVVGPGRQTQDQTEKKLVAQKNRHFVLVFELIDFIPKIKSSIRYFFENVMQPGDSLQIVTPLKNYNMKGEAWRTRSKENLAETLIQLVKNDVKKGNVDYKRIIEDLKKLARAITTNVIPPMARDKQPQAHVMDALNSTYREADLKSVISLFENQVVNLKKLRGVTQKALVDFGEGLKKKKGEKHVFLMFQREFLPTIDPKVWTQYYDAHQDDQSAQWAVESLFGIMNTRLNLQEEEIKRAFSDPSISAHFMFLASPAERELGIGKMDSSNDMFSAFSEIAKATGGTVESSANPEYLFKEAVEAFANYYLLYFSPKNYVADGKFHEIKVRVKGKHYKVTHRAGYIAD